MIVANVLGHRRQYVIYDDNGNTWFQSYCTLMAVVNDGCLEIKTNFWSVTTAKHMSEFLKVTHMMDAVKALIKHKVFENMKDFMYRCKSIKVTPYEYSCVYITTEGEETRFDLGL